MTAPLRLLDLFSGIGGFSLGLEATGGFQTVAFCEIEPFPRAVLKKHWPEVPCYEDVCTLTAERLARDGIEVDAICGGFPCQDISSAGKGAGIDGERSGLWREYARIIKECRPRLVIVENSPVLRTRGADRVMSDLETLGYACHAAVVGAAHAGAPHQRRRVWVVAYAPQIGRAARGQPPQPMRGAEMRNGHGDSFRNSRVFGRWSAESEMGRMAHGIPNRPHRIAALGNAVVPAVAQAIGQACLAMMVAHA